MVKALSGPESGHVSVRGPSLITLAMEKAAELKAELKTVTYPTLSGWISGLDHGKQWTEKAGSLTRGPNEFEQAV